MIAELKRKGRALLADQAGQTTVEWTLLIAAFGLPMIWVFSMLLAVLVEHYRMISLVISLPCP